LSQTFFAHLLPAQEGKNNTGECFWSSLRIDEAYC